MVAATYKNNPYGQKAVDFLQSLTLIGDYSGERWKLDDWQEDIVRELYGTRDAAGKRLKNKVSIWLPRGNGKTQLISGNGGYNLICGPPGQEIYAASSDRDKASRIYKALAQAIRADKHLSSICELSDYFLRIRVPSKNSVLQCLASDSDLGHSFAPSMLICDELHLWKSRAIYDALRTGFQKRKKGTLEVQISTAGTSKDGLAWELYSYAKKVKQGLINDPKMLVRIYEIEKGDDWTDPKVWRKCNPGSWVNFDTFAEHCEQAKHIKHQEYSFRQLYLNEWIEGITSDTWIAFEEWAACQEAYDEADLYDEPAVGALDLSSVRDLTALTLFFPESKRCLSWSWLPGEGIFARAEKDGVPYVQWRDEGYLYLTSGSRIVHSEVADKINEILQRFDCRRLVADPYSLHLIAPYLNQEPEIYKQAPAYMSPPAKWFESAVANRTIKHNGNPLLSWAVGNATVEKDKYENITPSKSKSRKRIDPCVALVMAVGAWLGGDEAEVTADEFYSDRSNWQF